MELTINADCYKSKGYLISVFGLIEHINQSFLSMAHNYKKLSKKINQLMAVCYVTGFFEWNASTMHPFQLICIDASISISILRRLEKNSKS